MKVINLGWCIAKLDEKKNILTIVSASQADEHTYTPAESVVVYGVDGLKALQNALNEAYPVATLAIES